MMGGGILLRLSSRCHVTINVSRPFSGGLGIPTTGRMTVGGNLVEQLGEAEKEASIRRGGGHNIGRRVHRSPEEPEIYWVQTDS